MDLFSPFIWLILFRFSLVVDLIPLVRCQYNRMFDLLTLIIVQIEIETSLSAIDGLRFFFDKNYLSRSKWPETISNLANCAHSNRPIRSMCKTNKGNLLSLLFARSSSPDNIISLQSLSTKSMDLNLFLSLGVFFRFLFFLRFNQSNKFMARVLDSITEKPMACIEKESVGQPHIFTYASYWISKCFFFDDFFSAARLKLLWKYWFVHIDFCPFVRVFFLIFLNGAEQLCVTFVAVERFKSSFPLNLGELVNKPLDVDVCSINCVTNSIRCTCSHLSNWLFVCMHARTHLM